MIPRLIITKGLKFTSTNFSADAEISAIRESENQVDVILTPSDKHSWEEKNWNLAHLKAGFERGEYRFKEPDLVNISIL